MRTAIITNTLIIVASIYLLGSGCKKEVYTNIVTSNDSIMVVKNAVPGCLYNIAPRIKHVITNLTITGTIDARDFRVMRDSMPKLALIDLSGVNVAAYSGMLSAYFFDSAMVYPANAIPQLAFAGKWFLTSCILPWSATSIGKGAFIDCEKLTVITVSTHITNIGENAFENCGCSVNVDASNSHYSSIAGVLFNKTQDTLIHCPISITGNYSIPVSTITTIGDGAFENCNALSSISIPTSVTSIGENAFMYCSDLTSITIPLSVTSIGDNAFSYCDVLTNVSISNSITSIGNYVFEGCVSLTSVSIPTSVVSIGEYAFSNSGLKSITIPSSVTTIEEGAFRGCNSLKSATISSSVTTIGAYAFQNCGFTSIILPVSITQIAGETFYGCSNLTTMSIPPSVTSIGNDAFDQCTGLTSITIPTSVTSIGIYAFYECSSLTSITIPASVTSLGNKAFYGCSGLLAIHENATTPISFSASNIFEGLNTSSCTLYVPIGSKAAYQAAPQWNTFTNIIEQ